MVLQLLKNRLSTVFKMQLLFLRWSAGQTQAFSFSPESSLVISRISTGQCVRAHVCVCVCTCTGVRARVRRCACMRGKGKQSLISLLCSFSPSLNYPRWPHVLRLRRKNARFDFPSAAYSCEAQGEVCHPLNLSVLDCKAG